MFGGQVPGFVFSPNPLIVAFAFGIVGGIAHEIVQSGGKVIVPKTVEKDLNLGTLVGVVLGVMSGLIALRGQDLTVVTSSSMINIAYTAAIGGFGFKALGDVDPKPQSP